MENRIVENKNQLPDELLDAISGGVVELYGQVVTDCTVQRDRVLLTTEGGDQYERVFPDDASGVRRYPYASLIKYQMERPSKYILNRDSFTKVTG